MEKSELRKTILERLKNYTKKDEESKIILSSLLETEEIINAKTILSFVPLSSEPNISLINEDERVLLPFIENDTMKFGRGEKEKSKLGFWEIKNKKEIEYEKAVMLVPLLAFDESNNRLGRGGGFYDRYIKGNRERIYTIGVAFTPSRCERIPLESHDERLDLIITAKGRATKK